jgi:fructose-1,6-bisphosphatase/inositol monophosphatase family enzyme
VLGLPLFGVLIALLRDSRPVVGVVPDSALALAGAER